MTYPKSILVQIVVHACVQIILLEIQPFLVKIRLKRVGSSCFELHLGFCRFNMYLILFCCQLLYADNKFGFCFVCILNTVVFYSKFQNLLLTINEETPLLKIGDFGFAR